MYGLPWATENLELEKLEKIILFDKKINKEYINLILIDYIGRSFIEKVDLKTLKQYKI